MPSDVQDRVSEDTINSYALNITNWRDNGISSFYYTRPITKLLPDKYMIGNKPSNFPSLSPVSVKKQKQQKNEQDHPQDKESYSLEAIKKSQKWKVAKHEPKAAVQSWMYLLYRIPVSGDS